MTPATAARKKATRLSLGSLKAHTRALAYAEEDVHRELVEPLVLQALRRQLGPVELAREQLLGAALLEPAEFFGVRLRYLGEQRFYLRVGVPTLRLIFQDEVSPHA